MKILFIVISTFLILHKCQGIKKTKCEVVQALRARGVPDYDLRDWLCLVEHESRFHYDATYLNDDGYTDYGLFQISEKFNCGRVGGTDSSTCWRLRTYGCADSCQSLIDSNITNDVDCAVRIKNCDGFKRWNAHTEYCSDVSGPEYDYSGC